MVTDANLPYPSRSSWDGEGGLDLSPYSKSTSAMPFIGRRRSFGFR